MTLSAVFLIGLMTMSAVTLVHVHKREGTLKSLLERSSIRRFRGLKNLGRR